MSPEVKLYTDGSFTVDRLGKKQGGWASLRKEDGEFFVVCGTDMVDIESSFLGSMWMEVTAIIEGLKSVESPSRVVVHTDYLNVIEANPERGTWKDIHEVIEEHREFHESVDLKWVKGHSTPENKLVDWLAGVVSRDFIPDLVDIPLRELYSAISVFFRTEPRHLRRIIHNIYKRAGLYVPPTRDMHTREVLKWEDEFKDIRNGHEVDFYALFGVEYEHGKVL